MKKDHATVRNPLTVISIFAGLAETAGTIVLPFVSEPNQATYIWFLMIFPVFLVTAFFITLNFNPKVLYAPSDFEDEKNYMDLFRPSSTTERLGKIEDELKEDSDADQQPETSGGTESSGTTYDKNRLLSLMQQDPRSRYMLAENLIIDRLSAEFNRPAKRDLALRNSRGNALFDAAFESSNGLVLVEIKVVTKSLFLQGIRKSFARIQDSLSALPDEARNNARFILAVAHDVPENHLDRIRKELKSMLIEFPMKSELRLYSLQELIENI